MKNSVSAKGAKIGRSMASRAATATEARLVSFPMGDHLQGCALTPEGRGKVDQVEKGMPSVCLQRQNILKHVALSFKDRTYLLVPTRRPRGRRTEPTYATEGVPRQPSSERTKAMDTDVVVSPALALHYMLSQSISCHANDGCQQGSAFWSPVSRAGRAHTKSAFA